MMLDYISTLPMWLQVSIIISGFIIWAIAIFGIIYRIVKYGIKIKVGPVYVDASEENLEEKVKEESV